MLLTHSVPVSHWTSGFGLFTSGGMKKSHNFKPIMWCSNAKQIDLWHQENTILLTGHVISSQDGKNMYLWFAVHGINNHCYSISRLILSLSATRKTKKLVSTMHNSHHVKVLYWVLFCLYFFWCVLGLGVAVSFVKFTLLPYLKGVLAQKLIKYLYQRKAKVQNIVMFAVNDHQAVL